MEEDDWGHVSPHLNYQHEYKLYYGKDYPLSLEYELADFQDVVEFVEIAYARWIDQSKRYEYTVYVNKLFSSNSLPYNLSYGKIRYKGYASIENNKQIINQMMFENKLYHSEKMIMSNIKEDKLSAVKLIFDCLEYLESNQPSENNRREKLAKSASVNPDSRMIGIMKNELKDLYQMANDDFDIRHNSEKSSHSKNREVLEDLADIEYIYNRAHATVQMLAIKAKREKESS